MKIISLFIAAAAFSLASCAQNIPASSVPSVVQNVVPSKYPDATRIEWEKKNGYYEAEFNVSGIEHSLDIDEKGTVLLHKQDIVVSELPAPVTAAIQKNYASYSVDDADKIDKNGTILFEIELEAKGKKDMKIFLTSTGESTSL